MLWCDSDCGQILRQNVTTTWLQICVVNECADWRIGWQTCSKHFMQFHFARRLFPCISRKSSFLQHGCSCAKVVPRYTHRSCSIRHNVNKNAAPFFSSFVARQICSIMCLRFSFPRRSFFCGLTSIHKRFDCHGWSRRLSCWKLPIFRCRLYNTQARCLFCDIRRAQFWKYVLM